MLYKIGKLREKKGFTLVELIVVIAIIAILTAVLVPLINNWSQQAAYAMLNDGAQTVSNVVNDAIAKFVAGGEPLVSHVDTVTGVKTSAAAGSLEVTIGTAVGKSTDTVTDADSAEKKIAVEIAKMLDATLTTPCAFTAALSNGAVAGVVYSTSQSAAPTDDEIDNIESVESFGGYEIDGYGAVGVSGQYKVD